MKLTVEHRVFLYATYVRTNSYGETRKIFKKEYKILFAPAACTIRKIVEQFRKTGSFEENRHNKLLPLVSDHKLEEVHSKLVENPDIPLDILALETGLPDASLKAAMKILSINYKAKRRKEKKMMKKRKRRRPVSIVLDEVVNVLSSSDDGVDSELILPDKPPPTDEEEIDPLRPVEKILIKKENNVKEEVPDVHEEIFIDDVKEEICIDDEELSVDVKEEVVTDCVEEEIPFSVVKEEAIPDSVKKEVDIDDIDEIFIDDSEEEMLGDNMKKEIDYWRSDTNDTCEDFSYEECSSAIKMELY